MLRGSCDPELEIQVAFHLKNPANLHGMTICICFVIFLVSMTIVNEIHLSNVNEKGKSVWVFCCMSNKESKNDVKLVQFEQEEDLKENDQ